MARISTQASVPISDFPPIVQAVPNAAVLHVLANAASVQSVKQCNTMAFLVAQAINAGAAQLLIGATVGKAPYINIIRLRSSAATEIRIQQAAFICFDWIFTAGQEIQIEYPIGGISFPATNAAINVKNQGAVNTIVDAMVCYAMG